MNKDDFEEWLSLSSVVIVREANIGFPDKCGVGCLIDYRAHRVFLTAAHVTNDKRHWSIQLAYIAGKGTILHPLGAMNFLVKARIGEDTIDDVDLSYVQVPGAILPFRQQIDVGSKTILREAPITIHTPSLQETPQAGEKYGFCGLILPEREDHFGDAYLSGDLRVYSGLSFLRTKGDFHIFSLPFKHPGHKHFKGCSGAPVVGTDGSVVGLVCSGDEDKNEIWAVSLAYYKTAIDILVCS
jgi:hypothetical protein